MRIFYRIRVGGETFKQLESPSDDWPHKSRSANGGRASVTMFRTGRRPSKRNFMQWNSSAHLTGIIPTSNQLPT